MMNSINRREFLVSMSAALGACSVGSVLGQSQDATVGAAVLGQGKYQWRVVPNWGVLDAETPVKDCHAMVQVKDGRLFLFTNETKNNIIIYDKAGKLLGKWGTEYPGAHGMTLTEVDGKEVLMLTDHNRSEVIQTDLEGKVLRTWAYPEKSGKYKQAAQYKPTHVAMVPDGGFIVVDGYGQNWAHRYDSKGEYLLSFGGNAKDDPARLVCAHGAWVDNRPGGDNLVWVTSRSEGKLKRFTLEGKFVDELHLPASHPNFIVPFGEYTVIPHLRGNTGVMDKADKNGFITILGPDRKVISSLGTDPVVYQNGVPNPMGANSKLFTFPHGLLIDDEQNIYVAQWNSGKTYPIKLERVSS
jgi:peptidylamidoglycolate lyase